MREVGSLANDLDKLHVWKNLRSVWMAQKRYTPEEAGSVLRRVELLVANGLTTDQACREVGIVKPTYYRWCKKYKEVRGSRTKGPKELERENSKLKRFVEELSRDMQLFGNLARGNL
jgi:putative transposase